MSTLSFLIGRCGSNDLHTAAGRAALASGEYVAGIQTRIDTTLLNQGALSSPVNVTPPRCDAKPAARKSAARCQLESGHDGAHQFPA